MGKHAEGVKPRRSRTANSWGKGRLRGLLLRPPRPRHQPGDEAPAVTRWGCAVALIVVAGLVLVSILMGADPPPINPAGGR